MAALAAGTRPPWVGLGAAVWVQIAAGDAFTFPLYSHSLKSVLGFNQKQLTMLGVANDIGENVGLIPGILSKKHLPWLILLIGAHRQQHHSTSPYWMSLLHRRNASIRSFERGETQRIQGVVAKATADHHG
ncbi:hypothetical protein PS2_007988 [Malus domestica]